MAAIQMNHYQKITLGFLIFLTAFWSALFISDTTHGYYNALYSFLFGLAPLFGGIIAIVQSKNWGRWNTAIGKSVFFIGLGIFLWGCGEMVWSYYNFFIQEPAPYPSLADFGFAPSIFFYGLGAFYLSKVTGARFALRNRLILSLAIVLPVALFFLSYYVLIVVARDGILIPEGDSAVKMVLDIAYPLGDFIALLIATIVSGLSAKYIGGRYTFDMLAILFGLFLMFLGDFIFSYTTTLGTFYNGNFGDLILTFGTSLLAFGVLGFCEEKTPAF